LCATVVFSTAQAIAQQANASAAPSFDSLFGYETVKVADGIYGFISRDSRLALVSGNSVVIAGDDGALVVDSGQFPNLTRKMIADIHTLTHQPVRILVNTHWHGDHNTGNSVYADAFPGIAIVSTDETREHFADLRRKFLVAKMFEEQGPAIKKTVETGTSPSGKPVPPDMIKYFSRAYDELNAAYPELKQAREVAPNQTFHNSMKFFLGKREVDVLFLGRGNTAGDAVVWVPDAKVLITGDLVVNPTPYATASFMTEWIETMNKLLAMDASVIVPGHGPVEHDKQYAQAVTDLLRSVVEQTQAAAKAGLTLEDTQKKVDVSSFRQSFSKGNPDLERNFDQYFLQSAIRRAYREVKEGPLKDEQ
jgi:glyoxylase-like metal-dependent hydrolase (beta-lactamase superfamily II)